MQKRRNHGRRSYISAQVIGSVKRGLVGLKWVEIKEDRNDAAWDRILFGAEEIGGVGGCGARFLGEKTAQSGTEDVQAKERRGRS